MKANMKAQGLGGQSGPRRFDMSDLSKLTVMAYLQANGDHAAAERVSIVIKGPDAKGVADALLGKNADAESKAMARSLGDRARERLRPSLERQR